MDIPPLQQYPETCSFNGHMYVHADSYDALLKQAAELRLRLVAALSPVVDKETAQTNVVTVDSLEGLEPGCYTLSPELSNRVSMSTALSLKRIADELTKGVNQFGETGLAGIAEGIRRIDPNGRY